MSDTIKYSLFENGSTWLKADFHLHTKSDKQFSYTGEENSFLNDYVIKLKERSIQVGVITNHNKFNKDEFVNLQKKGKKEEIFLLPGLELSVNDGSNGIHTLVVFSGQWLENGQDYVNQFLNVAFEGKTPDQYEQEDGRSSFGLLDTIKKLDAYHRDYFLIFAHVEQSSGFWAELDGGRISEFGKNNLFCRRTMGFQKVRTHDVHDRVCRTKVKSLLNNWYPAEVEGSDCKSIDDIGLCGRQKNENGDEIEKEIWLKLGDFTFEAVKYALKDYKNRVNVSKPDKCNHSYIKSITFEGGTLNGQSISFSPELNTLIGIRGSGKSSILEAVRYVLDIPFGQNAPDSEVKYRTNLIGHTLGSGGKATITAIDQYGSEYQIKRILNESPEVHVDGKLQPGVSIRETIIKNPIYFGQKDLSSSGEGFEKDLVEKLVGESLYDLRRRIEEQKQVVKDCVAKLRKAANIDDQIEEFTQKKQDAEFNLKKFQEYGVEDKFRKQSDFDTDDRTIKQIIKDLENFVDGFQSFISEYEDTIKNHATHSSPENQEFFDDFLKSFSEVIEIMNDLKAKQLKVSSILDSLKLKKSGFQDIKQKFIDEFAKTRRKIEAELKEKGAVSLNLEEYPGLKNKIETSSKMLEALNKQKSQEKNIKNELLTALSELNDLWQKEYQSINTQLAKINDKDSSLSIEPEFKGDKKEFLEFMKSTFRGSGIKEVTFSKIIEAKQLNYQDFGGIYKDIDKVKSNIGSSSEKFEQFFNENLESLLTYQVPNKFTIKYRGKELAHHSLGQRASALILFILSQQDNDVIIIDQPEDDLDNQTIYDDVIKLIRELKSASQFIFASHNANFPVLGDAEQIISCHYSDDKIENHIGSIDSPILQKEIVDIMEGGKEAFNRRKEIYNIWKSQN